MAKLPRYQNVGVKPLAPPDFDYANLRESARFAQTLSQQVDRMNSFIAKEAEREAEQRGLSMVQEEGAQQVLKKFSGDKKPFTVAETTAYQAATRIASAEIETEARAEINRLISEAKTNRTSFGDSEDEKGNFIPGVQSRLSEIVDGFPAALSDVDPVAAGLLRARLTDFATDKEIAYSEFYQKHLIQKKQGEFIKSLADRERDAIDYGASPHSTPDGLEKRINDAAQTMLDLQFDETNVAKWVESTRTKARKAGTIAEFQRLPTIEEKQKYLEGLEKKPLRQLGVEGTRTLVRSLQAELNNEITVQKGAARDTVQDIKDAKKIMTAGGDPGEQMLLQLQNRANGLGDYGAEAREAIANLQVEREAMLAFRIMPPAKLQTELNIIARGIPGVGGKGVDTLLEADILKSGRGLLRTMNTETQNDPLSFAARVGHIEFRPLDITSEEGLSGSIAERRQQARTVAAIYGVEPKFLTNEEATVFAAQLKQGDRISRMTVLGTLTKFFQKDAPDVLAQIAVKQPELAHIGGLVTLGLMDTANQALEGMDLIKQGNQPVGFTREVTDSVFANQVGMAFNYQSEARGSAQKTAKAIYTSMAMDRGLEVFDENLYISAISLAVGYNPNTGKGGVQEVRDMPVIAPPELDGEDLEKILDEIDFESLTVNTGQVVNADQMRDIRGNKNIRFMVMDHGRYYITLLKPGEDGFRYISDVDGDPVIFDALKYYGYRD
jgi:hypothetical protein